MAKTPRIARIIHADGTEEKLPVPTDSEAELRFLQEKVKGFIEFVRTVSGDIMYVNEDGRLLLLPHNKQASLLAGQFIFGTAVLIERATGARSKRVTLNGEDSGN